MPRWQTSARDRAAALARGPARGGPTRGEPRRQAQDLRRRGARRRQDLRDAADGARQRARTASTSSSASSRRTAARRPRRCSRASRSCRAGASSTRGQSLEEIDLDAILARRPQLVLVDELAHTNAPGSRHPKRYQDVEELLDPGIDVYTTVNIQHIESLNDVVAQITACACARRCPIAILDRADAVELVDLTPDDLIQRLKEGKVYVPKQAERALEHFFSPANLTALRELALRRTAERVDEQLLTHMQAHAIPGPWAAGERILVCVSEDPRAAGLVRYAKRLADRLHAPWTALYVETPAQPAARPRRSATASPTPCGWPSARRRGDHHSRRRAAHRRRRDRLTRKPTTSPRSSSASRRARAGSRSLHGSVVHDLVRRAGNISVHVIAGEDIAGEPIPNKTVARPTSTQPFDPLPYVVARLSRSRSRSASARCSSRCSASRTSIWCS